MVLKGYPRLSETFIAQEILGLQERGFDLRLISLRHPTDSSVHPVHQRITAPVRYLPEYLHQEPMRVLKGWWAARKLPGYRAARRNWLRDL
ncbi:MAG: colanic acid biosynthesis glycosyltransferase WcaL, partial [Hyphomicrobiales bacterium]